MAALADIAKVIVSPSEVFERIKEKPSWWAPLALLVALTVLYAFVSAPMAADFAEQELIRQSDQMSEEQIEQAQKMMRSPLMTVITVVSSFIAVIASFFLRTALLHLGATALGGSASFVVGMATVAYAHVPIIIQQVVLSVYTGINKKMVNPGLSGLLTSDQMTTPLGVLLGRIDVFAIWSFILLVIGFAITYRMSKGKAAALAAGYWVLSTMVAVLATAIGNALG